MSIVTIRDVARKAGKSRQVVSSILNNKDYIKVSRATRDMVLSAARELNYQPNQSAQSLRTGKTGCIGISTLKSDRSFIQRFDEAYLNLMYSGIGRVVGERGYRLVFQDVQRHEDAARLAQQHMVDGLIFLKSSITAEQFDEFKATYLSQLKVPYVIVHSGRESIGSHCVSMDCVQGGLDATKHLLEHGYRDVGCVCPEDLGIHKADLYQGYCAALREKGMQVNPELIFTTRLAGEYHGMEQGYRLAEKMVANNQLPRALFVTDDATAHGMVHCFLQKGIRVPEDVALITYGDEPPAINIQYGLTCVRQPIKVKGLVTATLLFDMINTPELSDKPHHVLLDTEMRIRKSCGCPDYDYVKEVVSQRDADKAF